MRRKCGLSWHGRGICVGLVLVEGGDALLFVIFKDVKGGFVEAVNVLAVVDNDNVNEDEVDISLECGFASGLGRETRCDRESEKCEGKNLTVHARRRLLRRNTPSITQNISSV
jgi:hypothetical protein